MLDVISFNSHGFRDYAGDYVEPLTPGKLTPSGYTRASAKDWRLVGLDEFLGRVHTGPGCWPAVTLKNFAHRLGVDASSPDGMAAGIIETICARGDIDPGPYLEAVGVQAEEPTVDDAPEAPASDEAADAPDLASAKIQLEGGWIVQLHAALDADQYNDVRRLVADHHPENAERGKAALYEQARELLSGDVEPVEVG